tara:strand:- start:187 stop:432 length:246 start_codon:yes stop_codon:yes gene_type:complete
MMKNVGVRVFFEIVWLSVDEPSIRDEAKVNVDQVTKTHILNLMSGLAQVIATFINSNLVIFADYLESDVSSTLYRQGNFVL